MTWRDDAACRGMDTSVFFPERGDIEGVRTAKEICARCTVTAECLEWAYSVFEIDNGIWGGLSGYERRLNAPTRGFRRSVGVCGTYAGYKRHLRREETPCNECREANRIYNREVKRVKGA